MFESLSDSEIVGLTVIGEARGEPIEGQVAVANVIKNRAEYRKKSYHDICIEPYQFSCWNERDPNYSYLHDLATKMIAGQTVNDPFIEQCLYISIGVVNHKIRDNTYNSRYYMTKDLFNNRRPNWAANAHNMKTIGNHVFFSI